MTLPNEVYHFVVVESFLPDSTSGLHGEVHIRPVANQLWKQNIHVRCSKKLSDLSIYPLGTKFRIKAKLTDREGGRQFLHSHHSWPFEVVEKPK